MLRVPVLTEGAMTIMGTRSSSLKPSSHVMKMAVRPARYVALFEMLPITFFSHRSPAAPGQLCVSLQRFGVTNPDAGNVSFDRSAENASNETSHCVHWDRIAV